MTRLPNFLVIGPPKCATTWLYFCLKQHPEIYLPFVKELHFFDKFYDKGLDWYSRYYHVPRKAKAIGEITPSYIFYRETAARIAKDLPGVKLIACFRNPIERAYSSYKHAFKKGTVKTDFETALAQNPGYIRESMYFSQLQDYLSFFPKENMLILIYEDIEKDPEAFLKRIFGFLGVDDAFVPKGIHEKKLPEYLIVSLYYRVADFSGFLRRKLGLGRLIDAVKKSKAAPLLDKLFHTFDYKDNRKNLVVDGPVASMKPETRAFLDSKMRPEIEKLAGFLGRDLGFWK